MSINNNNSNWRKEYEKLKWAISFIIILNAVVLDKIWYPKDRFRISYSCPTFPSIPNHENFISNDRKQEGVAVTIIGDSDTIIEDNDIIADYTIYMNSPYGGFWLNITHI